MLKVNIICPYFGTSGYVSHARGIVNALIPKIDIKIITNLPQGWEMGVNDAELLAIKKEDSPDRINIILDMPFNWTTHLTKKKNICYLIWEGDTIPISWVDRIIDSRVTQVWVPSTHVYEAIKTGFKNDQTAWALIKNKIKIVPHGFDPAVFYPEETQHPFTFVVNKGFRNELDRGGVQHALKAFIKEFNPGEARLLIKLNPAYAMPPEMLAVIIDKYKKELNKPETGDIAVTYESLDGTGLRRLYNEGDVFLNPTEGEAFSLPCIEAMACGKPVITTNFGGQTDFVNDTNGWLISYDLHEVKHEILYEGIKWGKPDIVELQAMMRKVFNEKDVREEKIKRVLLDSWDYTWERSSEKAIICLKELT